MRAGKSGIATGDASVLFRPWTSGASRSTRAALTPNLVPPELRAPSAALNQVMWNGAGVVGPAIGGVILGSVGLEWAYGLDVATYVVAIGFALFLHSQRPHIEHIDET